MTPHALARRARALSEDLFLGLAFSPLASVLVILVLSGLPLLTWAGVPNWVVLRLPLFFGVPYLLAWGGCALGILADLVRDDRARALAASRRAGLLGVSKLQAMTRLQAAIWWARAGELAAVKGELARLDPEDFGSYLGGCLRSSFWLERAQLALALGDAEEGERCLMAGQGSRGWLDRWAIARRRHPERLREGLLQAQILLSRGELEGARQCLAAVEDWVPRRGPLRQLLGETRARFEARETLALSA